MLLAAATLPVGPAQAQNPNYEELERQAIRKTDHCGTPDLINWISNENLKSRAKTLLNYEFELACLRHDACYRIKEKTQAWCDDRFREEIRAICEQKEGEKVVCLSVATTYHKIVVEFGRQAYLENEDGTVIPEAGMAGVGAGRLINLKPRRIRDIFSDDEFEVCGEIHNTSRITQEYEVRMLSHRGQLVDKEPDTYEMNIKSGGKAKFCLTTDWDPRFSIRDLGPYVTIQLFVDQAANYDRSGDMILIKFEEISTTQVY